MNLPINQMTRAEWESQGEFHKVVRDRRGRRRTRTIQPKVQQKAEPLSVAAPKVQSKAEPVPVTESTVQTVPTEPTMAQRVTMAHHKMMAQEEEQRMIERQRRKQDKMRERMAMRCDAIAVEKARLDEEHERLMEEYRNRPMDINDIEMFPPL